jgi:hypothetical protein
MHARYLAPLAALALLACGGSQAAPSDVTHEHEHCHDEGGEKKCHSHPHDSGHKHDMVDSTPPDAAAASSGGHAHDHCHDKAGGGKDCHSHPHDDAHHTSGAGGAGPKLRGKLRLGVGELRIASQMRP